MIKNIALRNFGSYKSIILCRASAKRFSLTKRRQLTFNDVSWVPLTDDEVWSKIVKSKMVTMIEFELFTGLHLVVRFVTARHLGFDARRHHAEPQPGAVTKDGGFVTKTNVTVICWLQYQAFPFTIIHFAKSRAWYCNRFASHCILRYAGMQTRKIVKLNNLR